MYPNIEADLTIIMATIAFMVWWFTGQSPAILKQQQAKYGAEIGQMRHVFIKRIVGMLFFGVIPGIVLFATQPYTWADYGVSAHFPPELFYWILGLSPVIVILMARSTSAEDNLEMYPEIRKKEWSRKLFIWSALTWMGYLVAYELMFRGYLLFACERAFGQFSAIVINTALYALVHVPKSKKEGIGAIPLGILLCIISFRTGTFWVALIIHWVLALGNEWFSLKYHPDINVKTSHKNV